MATALFRNQHELIQHRLSSVNEPRICLPCMRKSQKPAESSRSWASLLKLPSNITSVIAISREVRTEGNEDDIAVDCGNRCLVPGACCYHMLQRAWTVSFSEHTKMGERHLHGKAKNFWMFCALRIPSDIYMICIKRKLKNHSKGLQQNILSISVTILRDQWEKQPSPTWTRTE